MRTLRPADLADWRGAAVPDLRAAYLRSLRPAEGALPGAQPAAGANTPGSAADVRVHLGKAHLLKTSGRRYGHEVIDVEPAAYKLMLEIVTAAEDLAVVARADGYTPKALVNLEELLEKLDAG